jgi:hypothetical protein
LFSIKLLSKDNDETSKRLLSINQMICVINLKPPFSSSVRYRKGQQTVENSIKRMQL